MILGGLQKTSLVDFPGKIVCTVFTIGCNFRCGFCHNKDLIDVDESKLEIIKEKDFFGFLKKRKKVLDGVCITGGEPTLQKDLLDFCEKIKNLKLEVKLDSNGARPKVIENLFNKKLVDFLAIDYKIDWNKYSDLVGVDLVDKVKETISFLAKKNANFEIRTTVVSGIHDVGVLGKMAIELKDIVGKAKPRWFLQKFLPNNCLDEEYKKKKSFSDRQMKGFLKGVRKLYPEAELR